MNVLYCSETYDLDKCELENEKWGRWHSLNANSSQLCAYFLSCFIRQGLKYTKQTKNRDRKSKKKNYCDIIRQMLQFAPKFV